MSNNIFEQASRLGLYFETTIGKLLVTDLWSLPLTSPTGKLNLDDIARFYHKQLKSGDDVSFVVPERKSSETIQLKFDIVKHIIDVRLEEAKIASEKKARADKKQKILGIIAEKQDESLKTMDIADLQKILAEL